MQVTKLRMTRSDEGLVPAGEYFKRLAHALREANARKTALEAHSNLGGNRSRADVARNSQARLNAHHASP